MCIIKCNITQITISKTEEKRYNFTQKKQKQKRKQPTKPFNTKYVILLNHKDIECHLLLLSFRISLALYFGVKYGKSNGK